MRKKINKAKSPPGRLGMQVACRDFVQKGRQTEFQDWNTTPRRCMLRETVPRGRVRPLPPPLPPRVSFVHERKIIELFTEVTAPLVVATLCF